MRRGKVYAALSAAALAVLLGSAASATVIDFNELGDPTNQVLAHEFISQGYKLTCPGITFRSQCVAMMPGSDTQFTNGSYSPFQEYSDLPLIFSKVDGSAFLLTSFDVSSFTTLDSTSQGGPVLITYNLDDGTTESALFDLSGIAGFDTVAVGKSLLSLSVTTANPFVLGSVEVDNFRIADAPAVPEPATWAMMIGGMGAVGAAMRRKRQSVAVPAF